MKTEWEDKIKETLGDNVVPLYTVTIKELKSGDIMGCVNEIPGACSYAPTLDELRLMLVDAIHVIDYVRRNEE